MAEITIKFLERALLVLQYAVDEEMKKERYHDMLRDDIMEFVGISGCNTLNDMTSRSQERDIDLEHIRKRESDQFLILKGLGRRPKI